MDAAMRERVIAELRSDPAFADYSADDLIRLSTMGVGQIAAFRIASRDVSSAFKSTVDRLGPSLRALADAGVDAGDAAVLRVSVAWWQTRGLPDD